MFAFLWRFDLFRFCGTFIHLWWMVLWKSTIFTPKQSNFQRPNFSFVQNEVVQNWRSKSERILTIMLRYFRGIKSSIWGNVCIDIFCPISIELVPHYVYGEFYYISQRFILILEADQLFAERIFRYIIFCALFGTF